MLTKDKLNESLSEYYKKHCGQRDTDIWYEQPAANVWVFGRDEKIITLKSHLLTGKVEEFIE